MGIRFNLDKMAISVKEVPFCGHVITDKAWILCGRLHVWLLTQALIIDDYASLFNCTTAVRTSDSVRASS